jgi:hypothetical protein
MKQVMLDLGFVLFLLVFAGIGVAHIFNPDWFVKRSGLRKGGEMLSEYSGRFSDSRGDFCSIRNLYALRVFSPLIAQVSALEEAHSYWGVRTSPTSRRERGKADSRGGRPYTVNFASEQSSRLFLRIQNPHPKSQLRDLRVGHPRDIFRLSGFRVSALAGAFDPRLLLSFRIPAG